VSKLPAGWTHLAISEISHLTRRLIDVQADELYYQIGIRSHSLGVFHKEPVRGKDLGGKRMFWVEPNDFVVNIVFAWEGAVALISESERGMCASHRFPTFVVNEAVCDPQYLLRYFQSKDGIEQLKLLSPGGAGRNKTLTQRDFLKLKIPFPPIEEQRAIAAILSTWDEAITLTTRLIDALKRRKQALMQLLLTGEVRFAEFDGEWETLPLGTVANVKRGASPRPINDPKWFADTGRAWVRIADINASPTRFLNHASQYLSPLGEAHSVKVEVGELILSIAATIGVPKIVNIPACIHDGFVLLTNYHETIDRDFLYHYLSMLTTLLASGGQPGTQRNINSELVREIEIPILDIAEQKQIADVLTSADEELLYWETVSNALTIQKRGLMQQLLTGAVRVQMPEDEI
jgi:type I restriction enzyme, S subunit